MNRSIYPKILFYPILALLVCTNSFGQVSLVSSGGSSICQGNSITLSTNIPFQSYLWSTGETTSSISVGTADDYFVTVTDLSSNTFNSDTITTDVITISITSSITDLVCNGDQDGEIDITVAGGTSPYGFLWSNGMTTEDIANLTGGGYTVTITDFNGCSTIEVLNVNEPALLSILPVITPVSCAGGNDGSVDISVTGGNGSYSFEWDNGSTSEDLNGLSSASYTLTVTDLLGCAAMETVFINDGGVISPVITGNDMVCPGTTTALDAGSGYFSYLWSDGETTQSINVGPGTYSVTVSNNNGCTGISSDFIIGQYSAPAVLISAGGNTSFCDGGSVLLTASPGFASYLWSNGDSADNTTAMITDNYVVTVTDANGCTASANETVNVFPAPSINLISITDVLCKDDGNGVIEVGGLGGSSPYLFDMNGGGFFADSTFGSLVPGIYEITIQDNNGCTSMTQFFINEPVDYLQAGYSTADVLCYGDATGSIDLSVSGGTAPYSYNWSNGDTGEDISGLVAGIYTVTVTDANGCLLIFAIDIFEPSQITVGTDYTNISCYGGSDGTAIVFVSGGTPDYDYSWDTNPVQTDFVAFNLNAGTHTVTITDMNGCVVTQPFLISEPAQLLSSSVSTDVSCYGNDDGSATVTASGGTPFLINNPYLYSWNTIPVQTNATATGLSAGSYTVTISDSTGCINNIVVTIDEPNPLMASTSNVNVFCNGGNDGESTVIVSGGNAPYSFSWNTVPVQTNVTATGLSAGLYTVTVTDANGCITSANALINEPSPVSISGSVVPVTCFNGSDGKILLTVSGGNGGYTYFWNTSPAQTNANLINLQAGTYSVVVTDLKGCTKTASFIVTQPAIIATNENITNVTCYGGNNGGILLNITGGVAPYTYIWSNGNLTSAITGISGGSYTVTITDGNGCVSVKSFLVATPAQLSINSIVTDLSCSGGSNGAISLTISGGVGPYTYLWSNGSTNSSLSNLNTGIYQVTVTDANGCSNSVPITVNQPAALSCICNSNIVHVSCFGGSNGSITATPNGGTPPYSYLWSNGQVTQTANGLIAGTYTVTITDANGCQAVGIINVTQPAVLFVFATSANINCNGASNGSANATVTGGTPPYSYSWNTVPVQTNQSATGLAPGTYTITVTDSKSCTSNATVTITQPNVLSCSTTTTNITCFGSTNGTATVTASGGSAPYTYSWNTVPAKTTTTVIGLGVGTYTVTITDLNGCTKTCQASISQPSALVALYVPTNVSCNGGSNGAIDLTVTGGNSPYTYAWSNGASTQDLTGLTSGIYTVLITDKKGCNITTVITISQPLNLVCNTNFTNVSCFGGSTGSATVSVSGGTAPYQYLWSNGNTTSSVNGLPVGLYSVVITDNKGCTTQCNVNITQPASLSCSLNTCCDTILCFGDHTGALQVLVNGGSPPYTYSWNTVPVQTTTIASGLGAGSYTVTVTDSKGCTTTCSYVLSQPSPLTCSVSGNNASCNVGNDGNATVIASGGTPPYSYVWNTLVSQTTATATGLSPGNYTVIVTDANSCTTSCSVTISQPAPLSLNITATNITCNGGSNGSASVSVSGGTLPYAYLWSNGATTPGIAGLSAGTYTVTVTDGGNCTASATVIITEPQAISCSTVVTPVSCYGGNNGTATVTATGGTSPLSYSWNTIPVQHTVTATGLSAGTYSVVITDANGCTSSCDAIISEPAQLTCTTTLIQNVTCYGGSNGSASVLAAGGTAPYFYSWNTVPVQTSTTATGLAAGNYSVTVTDFNGCSSTCSVKIEQPDELLCSTSSTETHCGNDDGTATVSVTGGVSPYVYLWSDGQTTATATALAAGDYTITVTDANGCTTSCLVNVGASSTLIAIISGTDVACNGGSDGTATITVAGGEPPYSYIWNSVPAQTTATATGLEAGTYTVIATDDKGCTISKSITIMQPTAIIVTISGVIDVYCYGGNNGSATANPTGGVSPYAYLWSDGQTTQTASGLIAGTYTVIVTDFNTCTSSATVIINQPNSSISLTETHTNVLCFGGNNGSIDLTVTGGTSPYTYSWSNGITTEDITGLTSGTYTVIVTDHSGCTASLSVPITEPSLLSCNITGTKPNCFGGNDGTASVTVTGGTPVYSYLWSNGETLATATGLVAGTYTVVITDANNCTTSCNVTITDPSQLIVTVLKIKDAGCYNGTDGSAEANASGGTAPYTYLWSNGVTTKINTGLAAGTYTVTVTDFSGCTGTASVTINQASNPLTIQETHANVSCFGGADGSINITNTGGTPAYSFAWSNGATTEDINNLTVGTYTVIVTDQFGCSATATIDITQPQTAISLTESHIDPACYGDLSGSVNLSVSGGTPAYTFNWSNGSTTEDLSGTGAGNYTVTVTDQNGCTAELAVLLTSPSQITVSISKEDPACHNGVDGYASAIVSGGTPGYSYLWSNGQTTLTATGLSAVTYTVTVTDANGCTATAVTILSQPSMLTVSINNIHDVSCYGGNDGSALANAAGGTSPYEYLWSNGSTIANISGLAAGTYTVTVTDINGCTASASVTISQPGSSVSLSETHIPVNCFGGSDGSINLIVSGGTPSYTYLWNNGATTEDLSNINAGSYTVVVTDSKGCTASLSVVITQPTLLSCNVSGTKPDCYNGNDGTATVTASGGTPAYTYLWSNGQTTATATGLVAGTYIVTVQDQNNCVTSCSVTLTNPIQLVVTVIKGKDVSCNNGNDGSLEANPSGGTPPYTYLWSNGSTTKIITGLSVGTYTVTVTDVNGCTASGSYTLSQPGPITATTSSTNVSCFGGNDGTASVTSASGGTTPYTFSWNTIPVKTTTGVTGLSAGTYIVTITDANGCTLSKTITITQPTLLTCNATSTNATCAANNGSVSVIASGGTAPYTYVWNTTPVKTTAIVTGLASGTYTVIVTDNKGCTTSCSATVTGSSSAISCTINKQDVSCYGGNNGSATVIVNGGSLPYSYLWNTVPAQTNMTANGLIAGNYQVNVTDVNGCTTSCSVIIGQPSPLAIIFTKVVNVACNGGNTGTAKATVSGGTPAYSYLWSNGKTVAYVTNLSAGTYTVTVTDSKGCTKTSAVVISQSNAISLTVTKTNISCNGANNGTASATASGGTSPYSYSWNTVPVKTTSSVSGLSPGTYIVTVTDAGGCTQSKSVKITQPSAISISFTKVLNIACNGGNNGTAEANPAGGTPGYTFLWSNGQTIPFISGLTAGIYTVTVTDTKGCTKSASVTLTQPAPLSCTTTKTNASCHGSSNGTATVVPAGGAGPYTFSWNTIPVQTTQTISGLAAGTYQVTITDANNCVSNCSATINQPATLSIQFTKVIHVVCYGGNTGTAEANPAGGTAGYSFLWSTGSTSPYLTGLSAGNYTVTVTDSKGCTKSGVITINQPSQLICSTVVTGSSCTSSTGSATVNVTGGTSPYYYSWNTVPVKTTKTVTGLSAGTYVVTVTDNKGCTSACSASITSGSITLGLVSPVYAGGKNIRCYGDNNGAIDLTVTGASGTITYLWSNGKTTQDINGLYAGTYTVTVSSSGGCTKTGSITLTQPAALTLTTTSSNVTCTSLNNGTATVVASGGTPAYSYSWNTVPVKTTASVSGLDSGNYTVTVGDLNGCTKTASVCITQPGTISISGIKGDVSCYGGNTGSINITATGGAGPYSYLWNSGTTNEDRTGLPAGTYTVTVTDTKGCTKSAVFTILQPASPLSCSTATYTNVSCNGGNNGSITASATGGTSPYTYSWNTSPVKTTATISGLCAGTYTVTVTDNKGCVSSCVRTISQPSALTVNLSSTNVTAYGLNNGTATASPSGGTSPYTYSWNTSPVKTTTTVSGLAPGTYTVTVTDSKGCSKSVSVTITQPSPCQNFKSYTVGGWGAVPNGNNGGSYLSANFSAVFPNGLTIGDCGRQIKLTTAVAVQNFLPSGGTPRRLNAGILTNPTSAAYGNTLAGQLVALKLNMAFDAWDANFAPSSATLFKDLIIASGTFAGWTVEQLYNEANYKIGCGGCTSSYYSSLNSAITSINQSWDNGINNNSFLICPCINNLRPGETAASVEETFNMELKVYPNPTNGFVNIQFVAESTEEFHLMVTDITGRVVYTEKGLTENGLNGKFYDYSNLPKGVYILQVIAGSVSSTQRVVIQ